MIKKYFNRVREMSSTNYETCEHGDIMEDDNNLWICTLCGEEIQIANHNPEWKDFQMGCYNPRKYRSPKNNDRGLGKLFEEFNICVPENIKHMVLEKYNKIVGQNTIRGNNRNSVVAACLFHVYREIGQCRTSEYICSLFQGLEQQKMSDGLKKYCSTFKKARVITTEAEDLIKWIMTLAGIEGEEHYHKIYELTKILKSASNTIKRRTPQAIASAVVYYYLSLNPKLKNKLNLTQNNFSKKVFICCNMTVMGLVKELMKVTNITDHIK